MRRGIDMREYDEQTLHKVQQYELEILKDFIDLCNRHHIRYFGIAGTGIGAIRHKGFIPWDDDIDVAMLREDYEKFQNVAIQEYGDKYKLLNAETRENYPLMTAQWAKIGTEFRTMPFKRVDCDFGIYLDIFPLDFVSDDEKARLKQGRTAWFWSKLMILRILPFPELAFTGIKRQLFHAVFWIVHWMLRVLHISPSWLYQKAYKATTRYNHLHTKRVAFLCETSPFSNEFDYDDIFPLQTLNFEGLEMAFPRHLDKILTKYYGNYMELPPVDKRKNHYPYTLDFGDGK